MTQPLRQSKPHIYLDKNGPELAEKNDLHYHRVVNIFTVNQYFHLFSAILILEKIQ